MVLHGYDRQIESPDILQEIYMNDVTHISKWYDSPQQICSTTLLHKES